MSLHFFRIVAAASLCALALLCLSMGKDAAAREWSVDVERSSLSFSAWRMLPHDDEAPFSARFTSWSARISFDPQFPQAAVVVAEIDVGSVSTGEPPLDRELMSAAWFGVAQHPTARFEANGFSPLGHGRYRAVGSLTLRGRSAPATIEFYVEIIGDHAHAIGTGAVHRSDFGVGALAGPGLASPVIDVHLEIFAREETE